MVFRSYDHFLQYGDISVKRAISLGIALLSLSNPKIGVCDLLTKLAYESNKEVATNALFSLGLVAAGTNNSRISTNMRQLAAYYSEDPNLLQIVRFSQGLIHMGKVNNNPITNNLGIIIFESYPL